MVVAARQIPIASFMSDLLLRSPRFLLRFGTAAHLVSSLGLRLRAKSRQLRRGLEERFDARAEERARIARELHDSVLQRMQGLMFQLQAVRQLLPERPLDAIAMLDAALQRGDQALLEGRLVVRDLRESALRRDGMVEALVALGDEFGTSCCQPRPNYQVLIAGSPLLLEPAISENAYRIAREAIRNALVHARPSRIEAEVTFEKTLFSIRIKDDGIGIDAKILERGRREGHWGLPGMRERAVNLGGKLVVWSEHGVGTELELRVPGKIAYRRPKLALWPGG
jgi:signal transduction histidine kinase